MIPREFLAFPQQNQTDYQIVTLWRNDVIKFPDDLLLREGYGYVRGVSWLVWKLGKPQKLLYFQHRDICRLLLHPSEVLCHQEFL